MSTSSTFTPIAAATPVDFWLSEFELLDVAPSPVCSFIDTEDLSFDSLCPDRPLRKPNWSLVWSSEFLPPSNPLGTETALAVLDTSLEAFVSVVTEIEPKVEERS